ncbi:hypothetical protein ACQUHX_05510 [Pseudomonas aeruginosa]|uniref:hypothetical protein n=1 Tax=Pseudomonas aeruginosa TaxID=287 RepID=UPI003FD4C8A9
MDKRIRHTSELELAATKRARYFLDSAIEHIGELVHFRPDEKAVLIAGFVQAAATSYLAEALQDHVGDPLSGISEDMSGMIKRNL